MKLLGMLVGCAGLVPLLAVKPAQAQQQFPQAQQQLPQQPFPQAQQQFPQQQFPQQQFPQQQFPRERTSLEMGVLYGVSGAYGVGMGIWLSTEIGIKDPALFLIPPAIL